MIYTGALENFRESLSLTTPTATFPNILWAFVLIVTPKRALVSFYRPSIVTFPLSLHVSDNYYIVTFVLLHGVHATFPYTHL